MTSFVTDKLYATNRTADRQQAGSTNRRRRFGRPQGEPSVSKAKGPQAPQQSVRAHQKFSFDQ
jgi:hypothetical protein